MRFEVDNSLSLANTKVSVHSQVTFKTSQEKKEEGQETRPLLSASLSSLPTTYPLQDLRDRPIMTLQIRYMGCGHVSHTYIIITYSRKDFLLSL